MLFVKLALDYLTMKTFIRLEIKSILWYEANGSNYQTCTVNMKLIPFQCMKAAAKYNDQLAPVEDDIRKM